MWKLWNLNISDHKVSLEQSHTLHVPIVYDCFYTIMAELCSFDKGLQSFKYLLSGLPQGKFAESRFSHSFGIHQESCLEITVRQIHAIFPL